MARLIGSGSFGQAATILARSSRLVQMLVQMLAEDPENPVFSRLSEDSTLRSQCRGRGFDSLPLHF